jgi:hypothetical protein
VIEVWELSNDTSVTAVPPAGDARGVWSAALPAGARQVALRPNSDIPVDRFRARDGRALLLAPFAPGVRQVAYSYRLADASFPLRLPVERRASVLEILVEEPQGTATGPSLVQADAVTLEGRTFRRFLAQDVAPGAPIEVSIPTPPSQASRWLLPGALAAAGGRDCSSPFVAADRRRRAALGVASGSAAAGGRRGARTSAPGMRGRAPRCHRRARRHVPCARPPGRAPSEAERASYDAERAALKARLAALLAAEPAAASLPATIRDTRAGHGSRYDAGAAPPLYRCRGVVGCAHAPRRHTAHATRRALGARTRAITGRRSRPGRRAG